MKLALVNRRYLRVKVFQALYAYYRTDGADLQKIERGLFESINDLDKLYLYLIKLIMEMEEVASEIQEQNRQKQLPTDAELSKINWDEEHDDLRKLFKQFKTEDSFNLYMAREDVGLELDKAIVITLFKEHLGLNEVLHASLEERNIFWQDDLPIAAIGLIKTIQELPQIDMSHGNILADLYKNKDEDQRFTKELLRKTVEFGEEYSEMIADKAKNWETERIALLDMILMKMALTELEHFPTIPVKVTLNEYIELAKSYSTPKSKIFVNGVLDKLVADLKRNERINKRGRGLVE